MWRLLILATLRAMLPIIAAPYYRRRPIWRPYRYCMWLKILSQAQGYLSDNIYQNYPFSLSTLWDIDPRSCVYLWPLAKKLWKVINEKGKENCFRIIWLWYPLVFELSTYSSWCCSTLNENFYLIKWPLETSNIVAIIGCLKFIYVWFGTSGRLSLVA